MTPPSGIHRPRFLGQSTSLPRRLLLISAMLVIAAAAALPFDLPVARFLCQPGQRAAGDSGRGLSADSDRKLSGSEAVLDSEAGAVGPKKSESSEEACPREETSRREESSRRNGPRRLPGDLVRIVNLAEVFGYSPTAWIILLAAFLLDPSLTIKPGPSQTMKSEAINCSPNPSPTKSHKARGGFEVFGSLEASGTAETGSLAGAGTAAASHSATEFPRSANSGTRNGSSMFGRGFFTTDAFRMVAVTFSGGLTTDILKLLITRVRPYAADLFLHGSSIDTFSNVEGAAGVACRSFPSGHAAVAAGLTAALCWRYPRGGPLFVAIGIAAAVQRLTSGSHYLSDVAVGAAVALAWAAFWLRTAESTHGRHSADRTDSAEFA